MVTNGQIMELNMGVYNEVFYTRPKCGGRGYMQISQLVLGFSGFDLENPEYPSFSTYKRRFKSWSNALKKISESK